MKRQFFFIVLVFLSYFTYAQKGKKINTPEVLASLTEADSCHKAGGEGCDVLYKKTIALIQDKTKDDVVLIYHKLGRYYFQQNQLDSTNKYLELGLQQAVEDEEVEAFMNFKSNVLYNQGKTEEAMKLQVQLAERLESREQIDKLIFVYGNIGNQYAAIEDHEQSLKYLHKSFDLIEKSKDSSDLYILIAANIADGYKTLENDEKAAEWAYKAVNFPKIDNNSKGIVIAYHVLGRIKLIQENDSALYFLNKAIAAAERVNDKSHLSNALIYKSKYLKKKNKITEAIQEIEKAIVIQRDMQFIPGLANSLRDAGEIHLLLGNHSVAAKYFNEHLILSDSIKSKERFKAIKELTTKYETEKKEKLLAQQQLIIQKKNANIRTVIIGTIILLIALMIFFLQYKKNQKRKLVLLKKENENAVLKAVMNGEEWERNRISKNLHDGVAAAIGAAKMSLQSVAYLSEEKRVPQIERIAKLLGSTHTDVRRLAHNLMPVVLEKEGLVRALDEFIYEFNEMGILEININNQLPDNFQFPKGVQLMLYRIIQELVNNILKHAEATRAEILLLKNNHQLEITVTDNGVGYENDSESQGLYSIRKRLDSIGGRFQIEGDKQQGSRATLLLNLE